MYFLTPILRSAHAVTLHRFLSLSYKLVGRHHSGHEDLPPVLLLHDLIWQKKFWISLGKTISIMSKRTCVAVDLRNHGKSPHSSEHNYPAMANDVLKLIDKMSIEKAVLIGHGMGGKTALCVAMKEPKKIVGLIAVDTSPMTHCVEDQKKMTKILSAMKNITFNDHKKRNKARRYVRKLLRPIIVDDDVLEAALQNINYKNKGVGWILNIDALIKNISDVYSFPLDYLEKHYDGPTLFIGGQLSECISPDDLPLIRDIFPNAVIMYITGAGHNVQNDEPRFFLQLVLRFLKGTNGIKYLR